MRPRKKPKKIVRDNNLIDEIKPISTCVVQLRENLAMNDTEIEQLDRTLDAIIDYQLDKIFNYYE